MFRKFRIELTLLTYFFFIFNNLLGYTDAFDASGNLKVVDKNSAAALTSTQLIDDAVATIAAAFPPKAYSIAGTDGTNARGIKTDSSGELQVDVLSAVITSGTISTITNPVAVTQSGTWDEVGINDSGNSITVDNGGTFAVQAAQSGTWTVQPGNTANTTPWLTSIHDGTTKASVLDLTNSNPLTTAIVDSNGDQISSFGGGTQYTEGDTDASITGTAMLWEDGSDVLRAVSAAKPLPIDITDTTVAVTQSGTWNINNVSGTVSLPTGAATAAKQPALGTAGTASSDVITVQGIASMTALKVDGSAVTQPVSGTVTATIAAGAATIAKAEDSASANLDTGALMMAMQAATPADTAGTDLDYAPLQMSGGRLYVDASGKTLTVGSHAVTNAGTFVVQENGSALTSLQVIDDPVIADDAAFTPATSKVMMSGAEFDDVTPDSVDEGDSGAVRMSSNRNLYMQIRDGQLNERSAYVTASNALKVDGSAVTQPVSGTFWQATQPVSGTVTASIAAGATTIAKAEDVASADADVGVPAMAVRKATPANTSGADGDYEALQISAGRLWTSATIDAALPAGTNAIGKLAANSGVDIGDVDITSIVPGTGATNLGKAEDGGAASGDTGVSILLKRGDNITAAETNTDGDWTAPIADKYGRQIITLQAAPGNIVRGAITTAMTGTTSTSLLAASGNASLKTYVTSIRCSCGHATQGTYINIQDGNGGTALDSQYAGPGGGFVLYDASGLIVTTANTALYVANVTTGSDTKCAATGFYAP